MLEVVCILFVSHRNTNWLLESEKVSLLVEDLFCPHKDFGLYLRIEMVEFDIRSAAVFVVSGDTDNGVITHGDFV